MDDRPKLFEEFYEQHLSLKKYHTRNSRFFLQLDWMLKGTWLIFKVQYV